LKKMGSFAVYTPVLGSKIPNADINPLTPIGSAWIYLPIFGS